jgi:hypothetical protein
MPPINNISWQFITPPHFIEQYLNFPDPLPDLFPTIETLELSPESEAIEESIPLFISETAHDLQVKYQSTYGLYKNKPALFTEALSKTNTLHGYEIYGYLFNSDGSIKENFTTESMSDFNMVIPKLGFINHDNIVLLLERKHKRESPSKYRKGLRSDTLDITNLSAVEYSEAYSIEDPCNVYCYGKDQVMQRILHSLFFPIFYTYEEAVELLLAFDKLSCAITSTLALKVDFKTNNIFLYRNNFQIGILTKTKRIELRTELFTDSLIKAGVIIK